MQTRGHSTGGSIVLSSEMGRSTQQRLQPVSLTTGTAVSMASTGTGHIERKSQIGIGKILHAPRGREEEEEGGECVHTQQRLLNCSFLSGPALTGHSPFAQSRVTVMALWHHEEDFASSKVQEHAFEGS